jgi:epoxyqueuosine reductase
MGLTEDIKKQAMGLGFDLVGVTDASPMDAAQVELLAEWLKSGFAGQMNYMHRNFEKRINPVRILKSAQSVICVGLNYTPPKMQPESPDPKVPMGALANYALYEDYHLFIKKQLRKLAVFINSLVGGFRFRICVDSAPLAERALAARAGLGFIGKNRMLINPEFGSQILLGEIITSLKLEPDGPITANCTNCDKCIKACPTGALRPDGWFDANKCISYLTIEYEGQIPPDLAEKIGGRLFGCDECALACPYQKNAPACRNKQFKFYNDRAKLNLQEVLDMSEELFETRFADSCLKRSGLEVLKRNAEICLANLKKPVKC